MSSKLSLLWLQAFVAVARSDTLQDAAARAGLSTSTLSSHLRNLENHLGASLFDHSKRPLALTANGHRFLHHAEAVLERVGVAESEMLSEGPQAIRQLRLGLIDDFDTDVAPALTLELARMLPNCSFEHYSRPSHEILQLLADRRIEAGFATIPAEGLAGLPQRSLLRDPYIVIAPAGHPCPDLEASEGRLPFLRYSPEQHIGRQIEAQLNRLRVQLPRRLSAESNQALMAMVAAEQNIDPVTAGMTLPFDSGNDLGISSMVPESLGWDPDPIFRKIIRQIGGGVGRFRYFWGCYFSNTGTEVSKTP